MVQVLVQTVGVLILVGGTVAVNAILSLPAEGARASDPTTSTEVLQQETYLTLETVQGEVDCSREERADASDLHERFTSYVKYLDRYEEEWGTQRAAPSRDAVEEAIAGYMQSCGEANTVGSLLNAYSNVLTEMLITRAARA